MRKVLRLIKEINLKSASLDACHPYKVYSRSTKRAGILLLILNRARTEFNG
jgi:hypothetical protein